MLFRPYSYKPLSALIAASLVLPLLLSSCFLFTNKTAEAMVRIQADNAIGQGIIVDSAGYVITSSHAIKGSQSLSVELKSGTRYEGIILCLDQAKDMAVLKLQGKLPALRALPLGDSDLVQQYDEVTVSGYPPGAKDLVTLKGAVIGFPKAREAVYLQTNATLDPELAGSVVLNKAGEMIGIMSWNFGQAGREGWVLTSNEIGSVLRQAQEAEADPLTILSMETTSVSNNSAVVSWKTNRPASGLVEYGLLTSYGSKTLMDAAQLKVHGAAIANLQPKTAYHFRVRSVDGCGNEAVSADQAFTTMATAAQSGKLSISNASVFGVTSDAASVKWITNKPATTIVSYSGVKDAKPEVLTDRTPVYEHNVRLNGLDAEMKYSVTIRSENEYAESAQQALEAFSTPSVSLVCCRANCRLPDFNFKTLQGADFTSADIRDKRVFMVFVKTGCSTCTGQAIYLNDILQTAPKGSDVLLMAVISSEKPAEVIEWMKKYGLNVPVYIDPASDLANTCKLRTIPSAFFLEPGLIIRYSRSGGYSSKKEMELALDQLR